MGQSITTDAFEAGGSAHLSRATGALSVSRWQPRSC